MDAIDILNISLTQILHQEPTTVRLAGRHQQVNMIGHEAPRMDCAVEAHRQCLEMGKVNEVVVFSKETRPAVVSPLNDVNRDIGKHEAAATGHLPTTRRATQG
jgi:hypothetical protein